MFRFLQKFITLPKTIKSSTPSFNPTKNFNASFPKKLIFSGSSFGIPNNILGRSLSQSTTTIVKNMPYPSINARGFLTNSFENESKLKKPVADDKTSKFEAESNINKTLNLIAVGCTISPMFNNLQMLTFSELFSDQSVEIFYHQLKALGLNVRFRSGYNFISIKHHDPASIFVDETIDDINKKLENAKHNQNVLVFIQPTRQDMIVKIPVTTTNISEFCRQTGQYQHYKVASKIFSFLKEQLKQHDINIDRVMENGSIFSINYFNEVIKNAYDAYAMGGLVLGNHLVLKVVIKEKDDKVIVKIKNNGIPFKNHAPSTYFNRTDISADQKEEKYLGGFNQGLFLFEGNISNFGAKLKFKSRKAEGVAVYLEFDKKEHQVLSQNAMRL